jgi:tRNA (guanine-N7-)-methyltransferase
VSDRATPGSTSELRFYGRRRGRKLRAGQEQRLATLLPRLAIAVPADGSGIDPRALFGFPVEDVWLEIGFGGGEHLAARAATRPQTGFIGCEVFRNGIVALLAQVDAAGLQNVRIYPEDARRLLAALPDASIGRGFVLFPDPWPKARHAARRFIGPGNLDQLARVLRDGAELCVATDDPGHVGWSSSRSCATPTSPGRRSAPRTGGCIRRSGRAPATSRRQSPAEDARITSRSCAGTGPALVEILLEAGGNRLIFARIPIVRRPKAELKKGGPVARLFC